MLVDFRPHSRLRAKEPFDLTTAVTPVMTALSESALDLSRVRIVCDWIQYKDNFREVVDLRPLLPAPAHLPGRHGPVPTPAAVREDVLEVAVDVRRSGQVDLHHAVTGALRGDLGARIYLEDWGPGSAGCIWDFNSLYWSALEMWEKATGRAYEQALPGGESDARNVAAARDLIADLFRAWDDLAARGALPDELYVVELGVGNGNQAKVFLDEFRHLDEANGGGYYRRLQYLMCDYSQHVLDLAGETVADHVDRVSSVRLDATRPLSSLGFLKYKVFLVYVSNVYDNLPTDELAQLGGRTYRVETRAYLPPSAAAELAGAIDVSTDRLTSYVHKLLRLGPALLNEAAPSHFSTVDSAVEFWRSTWAAVRLEERYVPVVGLDEYALTPTLSGEILRPLLESGADLRMHVNNGALRSFTDSLALLHPFGKLVCHDLFVADLEGYRTTFRGPGKYDGSVVNWVNGPLMAHVGRRQGFDVHYEAFRHRSGGNIVTMTAQVRD